MNNMIGADGAFYLGEQLRFNPQLTVLSLALNGSIPYNHHLDIKSQLKYNQLFQRQNKVPNLRKERDYLKKKLDPKNFLLIETLRRKAKSEQMKQVQMNLKLQLDIKFNK